MKDNIQTILVTGANGQLSSELKNIAANYPSYHFLFTTKEELPIHDPLAIKDFFIRHPIHYCINTAGYTAVDNAEAEKEKAFLINATAAGELAAVCKQHHCGFIHISTDYIFDGTANKPYKETDPTHPIGAYGTSKLKGEELVLQNDPSAVIIRTSWLYSSFGNNFVKTVLRLMKEKESINVVNDQYGCPTYAADLAEAIMQIVVQLPVVDTPLPMIFNYANSEATNWFEFANAIKELTGSKCNINAIPTSQNPTSSKRPQYSVLDTTKIQETFHINIPNWKDSLKKCLNKLNRQ